MKKCKCRQEIDERLRKHLSGEGKPEVEKVEFQEVNLLSGETFTHVQVSFVGRTKSKTWPILHAYCPWCGCKYPRKA
jgi:hypothetical protein